MLEPPLGLGPRPFYDEKASVSIAATPTLRCPGNSWWNRLNQNIYFKNIYFKNDDDMVWVELLEILFCTQRGAPRARGFGPRGPGGPEAAGSRASGAPGSRRPGGPDA